MKFIKLENIKDGHTNTLINVDTIAFIEDLRSDKVFIREEGFQYTIISLTNGKTINVKETEEEILSLIANS